VKTLLLRMNVWRSLRGLPRDLWVLSVATLINRLGMMGIPFLVLYLTRELGWSAPRAGLTLGVYGTGAIIAAPISGRLCDRIGGLPIIRASLLGAGVILLMIPFAHSFPVVIALVLAWSLVSEGGRPATLAMVADLVPNEQRKPAFALIRLAINLGMSVGPAAGGFIAAYSFRSIFFVNAFASLAAGVFLVAVRMKGAPHSRNLDAEAEDARLGKSRTAVLSDRRLLVFVFATFLVSAVFFQHEGALPLFLVQDLRLSTAFYGMLFTINTLMIVFLEVPLNAATAHWPHRWALAAGSFLFATGSGLFGFATGPVMIVFGIIVWTFGEMMLFPQAAAYVADIAPAHRRGSYMGAYSLAFSIAFAVAPWAGTTVFANFGARILWASVFLVGIVATVIMLQVTAEEPTEARAAA
jgi:MFS family permease